MPQLILTVDTEVSNFPNSMGIWGKIGSEDWGLARLIDEFDALGVKGTFFLDAYGADDGDLRDQRRAAELITHKGHDLQLHTHPGPSFDRKRDQLKQYSLPEQRDIIAFGNQRIREWTGKAAVLHRAGDWAASHESLAVLKQLQFRADFSSSRWSPNCGITRSLIDGNGWQSIDGMLCGVGTCYRDRLTGRLRRVDLAGVSCREAMEVLQSRVDPFFLTLHSFSLLRYDSSRRRFAADPGYVRALGRFVEAARRLGYETLTALEAVDVIEKQGVLAWQPLPTTSTIASGVGILKSVRERLVALRH